MLIGAVVIIDTFDYPAVKGQGFGYGPAFYPRVLAGALIGFGVLVLFQELLRGGKKHPAEGSEQGNVETDKTYTSIVIFLMLCVFSTLFINYIGFLLSGFLLIFISSILIRGSTRFLGLAFSLFYSIGMIILVYIVFDYFIGVDLPGAKFF